MSSSRKLFAAIALSCLLPLSGMARAGDLLVRIRIHVVDEAGKPLPYATLWGHYILDLQHPTVDQQTTFRDIHDPQLDAAGLARLVRRYGGEFEIFSSFYFMQLRTPVGVIFPPLTGTEGETYDEFRESGWHSPRSSLRSVGYVAMKAGYVSTQQELDVSDGKSSYDITLKMTPEAGGPHPRPAYLQTLDRVRYELSFTERNAERNPAGATRLAALRAAMEQAMQQAIDAGDSAAAALIGFRTWSMPSVDVTRSGEIVGFRQTDTESPANQAVLARATALDPGSQFGLEMRAAQILHEMRTRISPGPVSSAHSHNVSQLDASQRELAHPYMQRIAAIADQLGDKAPIALKRVLIDNLVRMSDYDGAEKALRELVEWEPLSINLDEELAALKRQRERSKMGTGAIKRI